MNNMINVEFATEKALDWLKTNPQRASEDINNNIFESEWLKREVGEEPFELRKAKIPDFELKTSIEGMYNEVEFQNAITLYESLKDLPRYILTDERLWAWINIGKCYRASIQAMPINRDTTFAGTWLFTRGKRRGLFFGAHSRSYFWVEFTVDESLEDKYELTKFVFDKKERIRHLTFDNKSGYAVYCAVKAEKRLFDKYANDEEFKDAFVKAERSYNNCNIYTYIRKYISLIASVRILETIPKEKLTDIIYKELERILFEIKNGNLDCVC